MTWDKKFKLIIGGAANKIEVNKVAVEVISDSATTLPVDARVFEEDTYLVLTVDPVMRYTDEHPIKLMTHIMDAKPRQPGSVVTKDSSWYAVVHDLDADPICRKEWIAGAYTESLKRAEEKGITRLGLPVLGTVHGRFPSRESMDLLLQEVRAQIFFRLKRIVILAEKGFEEDLRKMLGELTGKAK
jgi:hypothetical protein